MYVSFVVCRLSFTKKTFYYLLKLKPLVSPSYELEVEGRRPPNPLASLSELDVEGREPRPGRTNSRNASGLILAPTMSSPASDVAVGPILSVPAVLTLACSLGLAMVVQRPFGEDSTLTAIFGKA